MERYLLVDPEMGTENHKDFSRGNCYPVCAVPRGMNFFSLQNEGDGSWFYSPRVDRFEALRLTHLPSPWLGDWCRLWLWGADGHPAMRRVPFDRKHSEIRPAYLKIPVPVCGYTVELAPTMGCACLRFTFRDEGEHKVVVKGAAWDHRSEGNSLFLRTYDDPRHPYTEKEGGIVLYGRLSAKCAGTWEDEGDFAVFRTEEKVVELVFSSSFLSFEMAEVARRREVGDATLEEIRARGEALWSAWLGRIRVEDQNEEKRRVFYSCLYRAGLWPRRFYEVDEEGRKIHVNTATFLPTEGVQYTDNGFWDTFRTLYPLLSLIDREAYAEMAEGFLAYYRDTGWLPKWVCPRNVNCMPGMLIEAVLSDAIVKEIVSPALGREMLLAMRKDGEFHSTVAGEGRVALDTYDRLGYVPYTAAKESVNETLDNAFGDFCIARAAEKLGEEAIREKYDTRSLGYRQLFDPETGFIRGKDENGEFRSEEFDPFMWGRDYTEGSVWQNGFGAYHDIEGMNALYGGKLSEKIDELMATPPTFHVGSYNRVIHEMTEMAAVEYGQCAVSNQPSFHVPFLYSALGDAEKTSYHLSNLLERFRLAEGFPGDEDNGSMASYFVLASLGLYQIAPSRPVYQCARPYFERVEIDLENGKVLTVTRDAYPEQMRGEISYADLMAGGEVGEKVAL